MPQRITGLAVSAGLTEALGLTGKLALSLDDVVVPTISVGNLDEALWGPQAIGHLTVPAGGAGLRSEIEIALPTLVSGQGAAMILDAVDLIGAAATQNVYVGPSPGMGAATHTGAKDWLDIGRAGNPVALISGKNDAVATPGLINSLFWTLRVNESLRVPLGWVLREYPPTGVQQGLMFRAGADNQQLRLNFYWRERVPR